MFFCIQAANLEPSFGECENEMRLNQERDFGDLMNFDLENDFMLNFRFGFLWVKKMVWKIEEAELNLLEMTF
jgi:hypothetical protein